MRQTTEHQLKIVLRGTKPPLWRRVVLASDITLGSLHEVIQRAFGWTESHLHGFEDGLGREYGPADAAEESYFGSVDEESISVADVLSEVGDRLDYTYDFGDDWVHRVTAEKVLPAGSGERAARCVGGRRADPPAEGIGGVRGMETVLAMLADPESADSEEVFADLVGELRERGHDPAAFDAREVSRALESLALRTPDPAGRRRSGGKDRALVRRDGPRLTGADLAHCTCGQCRVGYQVRSSLDLGGFPDGEAEPQLLPAVSLPPRAELAATARTVPLFLFARGEETGGHDGLTTLWLTVDTFAAMTDPDVRELTEFVGEADGELCATLSPVADELWRSGHPSAADVLTALGDALRDVDKKLAKRLRTSANKARSRR
ncbi:plasmid pRiA4b ORF-3 family protein [Kitasatospora sp. NPDC056531]|uniref:plasmid pRiA4b ORF-3 family protein n=1 Tax=Kitasatospora sp. NPDC056531 TaxID=3345856 RepID=UPI0036C2807D